MKTKYKELWIEALRSGEYEQGAGALCDDGKWCPLGVLCDVHRKVNGSSQWELDARCESRGSYLGQSIYLPVAVCEDFGIEDTDPELDDGELGNTCITTLNDELNVSFEDFAKLIEEQL